jgi:type II secretory pathway pseudopilin PulG
MQSSLIPLRSLSPARRHRGFSLVEALIVIAVILGITLALSAAMQGHLRNQERSNWTEVQAREMAQLASALAKKARNSLIAGSIAEDTQIPILVSTLITEGELPQDFAKRRLPNGTESVGISPFGFEYRLLLRKEKPTNSLVYEVRGLVYEYSSATVAPSSAAFARTGQSATPEQIQSMKTDIAATLERSLSKKAATLHPLSTPSTRTVRSPSGSWAMNLDAWFNDLGRADAPDYTFAQALVLVDFSELGSFCESDPGAPGCNPPPPPPGVGGASCIVLDARESGNCVAENLAPIINSRVIRWHGGVEHENPNGWGTRATLTVRQHCPTAREAQCPAGKTLAQKIPMKCTPAASAAAGPLLLNQVGGSYPPYSNAKWVQPPYYTDYHGYIWPAGGWWTGHVGEASMLGLPFLGGPGSPSPVGWAQSRAYGSNTASSAGPWYGGGISPGALMWSKPVGTTEMLQTPGGWAVTSVTHEMDPNNRFHTAYSTLTINSVEMRSPCMMTDSIVTGPVVMDGWAAHLIDTTRIHWRFNQDMYWPLCCSPE